MGSRKILYFLLFIIIMAFSCSREQSKPSALYPPIEPYMAEQLRVSNEHYIYYELSGNQNGQAVFVLHGGPGGGSSPVMRQYFDPEKFLIVLHDQRGAGKSKPRGALHDNNIQELVSDIDKLRLKLGREKIYLFGGSWGSTLALAYAEAHPRNVAGMVLRGVFTATKEEIDHLYHGGVRKFFPDVYTKFARKFMRPDSLLSIPMLMQRVGGYDSLTVVKYSDLWARYELKISSLEMPDETIDTILEQFDPWDYALLETYYMLNNCFLEENQLLNNIDKIQHIPVTIIQGRYDMICPPISAYRLHKKMPRSKLIIVEKAGHSAFEPGIEEELVKAANSLF